MVCESDDDVLPEELTIYHHNGMCLMVELKRFELLGKVIYLGPITFETMHLLIRSPEVVFTRDDIMTWLELRTGNTTEVYDRTVDTHIKRLRQTIFPRNSQLARQVFKTIYGRGYALANLRAKKAC